MFATTGLTEYKVFVPPTVMVTYNRPEHNLRDLTMR